MKVSYENDASQTVALAAKELSAYLGRMIEELSETEWEIQLVSDESSFRAGCNDSFRIRIGTCGGCITGNNDRSVLLAVYDYLHYLGCRFLMPQKEYEVIPVIGKEKLEASYEKQASFFHRGVCIEGADSFENILSYIEWLPKVGFNSFFLQFKSPYAFMERWYRHLENPYVKTEGYMPEDAVRDMERFEAEIKRRGLMLHKAGHGWTGEVLGYHTVSWNRETEKADERLTHRMAMINGKRELYGGVPANTNLCYHNEDCIDAFADLVVDYAKKNPSMDYLHVWLADEYNNICECPECAQTTLSDQYVELLNEIDRRLTEENLDTHIVFLLYQELLWPPVTRRLDHQERFVLMFAPISRTFEKSYELDGEKADIPVFVRNHVTLPTNLRENMAFLRQWQKIFNGGSFVYDYPLGRAHYGDFGYVHIAKVIHSDIQKLDRMKLDGYISCQELRAAFPNALPNYMMAYTLFQKDVGKKEVIEEYFRACYGEEWEKALDYLTRLSELNCCDYVNGKGERDSREIAGRMERVIQCCREFEKEIRRHCGADGRWDTFFWELLAYHRNYILLFADALRLLAEGEEEQAGQKWEAMREYICLNEQKYQPFLDVYRILEVTKKYTGLYQPKNRKEMNMKHEYYYYNKEQFLAEPKLPVEVLADNEAVFREIAREMAEEIKRKNALGEKTVFICPVGPVGQYPYFVEIVNNENISLKSVWFLNMDEYLTDDKEWIPKDDKLSFRGFMDRTVYTKIRPELVMPPEQRVFPDPHNPGYMGELIEKLGGVDICFGGIGINGHLAFNEADDSLSADEFRNLHTRVLKISPETKTANAIGDLNGAIDDMPKFCITIGMNEIYNARKVRLGCFRDWHRSVVRHAAYGEVSGHFPATLMQQHPDALLRITEFVAKLPEEL